jgi:putative tryptophan/tyrosine transport system substrate-binding protein
MQRKITVLTVCVVLFTLSFPVEAQQAKTLARIAYLGNEQPPLGLREEEAFLRGLREHGWIEGQKIVIERRYWENRAERLAELADELVRLKVDVIVTSTWKSGRDGKESH